MINHKQLLIIVNEVLLLLIKVITLWYDYDTIRIHYDTWWYVMIHYDMIMIHYDTIWYKIMKYYFYVMNSLFNMFVLSCRNKFWCNERNITWLNDVFSSKLVVSLFVSYGIIRIPLMINNWLWLIIMVHLQLYRFNHKRLIMINHICDSHLSKIIVSF